MVGRRETEFWLPIISDISIEDYMLLFSGGSTYGTISGITNIRFMCNLLSLSYCDHGNQLT